MKKYFFSLVLIVLRGLVFAEEGIRFRVDPKDQYVQGALGFGPGGVALGADYELGLPQGLSWGGLFRFYPENTNAGKPKVFHLGSFLRPHWSRQSWDFYTHLGAGLTMASDPARNETLITPTIGIGTSYAFKQSIVLSIESVTIYGITSDAFRGPFNTDYMVKMRFRLN